MKVIILAGLVVPTSLLGNIALAGATLTGTTPVPDRATDCEPEEELLATVRAAMRLPRAEGVNVTLILHVNAGASVFGLSGQFPLQE